MNATYRSTEKDVYTKILNLLRRLGYPVSGVTRYKRYMPDGAYADINVMVAPNRWMGLKFKGDRVQLTEDEREATQKNLFTVIRSEEDLYEMLDCVNCMGCKGSKV